VWPADLCRQGASERLHKFKAAADPGEVTAESHTVESLCPACVTSQQLVISILVGVGRPLRQQESSMVLCWLTGATGPCLLSKATLALRRELSVAGDVLSYVISAYALDAV
jgi:hypothetical protein